MTPPPLLKVPPSVIADLPLKVTQSGITMLKLNSMRVRYCGNKHSHVDINGKLWLERSEFLAHLKPKDEVKKKGRGLKPAAVANKLQNDVGTKINDLSTSSGDLPTDTNNLSTTARRVKENRINKREVRGRILAMINSERGKKELYFWTVTFPAGTADDVAFKMYNIWLTSLRKWKLLKNYIWVAERQQNKTIHFHIAIPHKMNVHRANAMMQGTLKTFARRGEIPFHPNQCKRYNGVDIAKNRNTKRVTNFAIKKGSRSLITYLTKYIAKNDGTFPHLAWHNSRGYSGLFTGITLTIAEFKQLKLLPLLHREKRFSNDYISFIPWIDGPPPWYTDHLFKLNSYVQSQLDLLSTKN